MKRPTAASLKKVTAENLATLGAERLAQILVAAAEARPDLKRRLRMELAAEQGADHLSGEIDKRLAAYETSRSKVGRRQRPAFVRDLDGLRQLIVDRLAELDREAALSRLWRFMDVARRVGGRMRDKDGSLAAVFAQAAADIGGLIQGADQASAAKALVAALIRHPAGWPEHLAPVIDHVSPGVAAEALQAIGERDDVTTGWLPLIRRLADAAGNAEAFRATFTPRALRTPQIAAEVARRLLAAGAVEAAGEALREAEPEAELGPEDPDFAWESAWIDYLEQSGRAAEAQEARWASFLRTLSAERAKAFTRRLADFDDVEAEHRAFELAAAHPDFERGLRFLMDWPALAEAARMIQARPGEAGVSAAAAEAWAGALRVTRPAAAELLLRKAAAAAFRRRDYATSDRLTKAADDLAPS